MSVELLAPAGDFDTALAAFDAGADAVYCGLSDFSARAFATNFSIDGIKRLMRVANARGKKVYITFNTVVDEADVEGAVRLLSELDAARPSALIVQDLGIARLCRRYFPELELHASTQLVAHNLEGVLAIGELGFTRAVLARELSAAEISSIAKRCGGIELECFIHGALCYSISGLCLFSAMEKDRSGNRGKCAYCCRQGVGERGAVYPFSMKDLRLGEGVGKLVDAGVTSLKIEGRMKSALYVASATRYYRQILGNGERGTGNGERGTGNGERGTGNGEQVTLADLETVFSRRTTSLYLDGRPDASAASPVDPESLGHLGAPIGTVKRVTKDRDGLSWLRFHTLRALEKHDGLQFAAKDGGKPLGFGISLMRQAISRAPVFAVAAGTDVEVLLPSPEGDREGVADLAAIHPGDTVYCSMSNAVKRMFPIPSYRPSDYPGILKVDLAVTLAGDSISAVGMLGELKVEVSVRGSFAAAKCPEKTYAAVERAFSKLGETDYALGRLSLVDPDRLFAPMSVLNDLRRDLVERLDAERDRVRQEKLERALGDDACGPDAPPSAARRIKLRAGQRLPAGDWDEVVVAIGADTAEGEIAAVGAASGSIRLALPVYTAEPDFNRLRIAVKRFLRAGFAKWEASDLATLRMLRGLDISDITADWSCYAFNSSALKVWSELGVSRFVASPENNRENLQFLAESGYDVEFLVQQSTPLFISLTRPAAEMDPAGGLVVFRRDGLWVTAKKLPRTFAPVEGRPTRVDLSWSPE